MDPHRLRYQGGHRYNAAMSVVLNSFLLVSLVLVVLAWLMLFYGTVAPYFSDNHCVTVISLAPESKELERIVGAICAAGRQGCRIGIFHRRNPVALTIPVAWRAGPRSPNGPPPQIHFEKHVQDTGELGIRLLIPVQDHFGKPAIERMLRAYGHAHGVAFAAETRNDGENHRVEINFGRDSCHAADFAQYIRVELFGPEADDSYLVNFSGADIEPTDETEETQVSIPKRPLRALMHYFPEWRRSEMPGSMVPLLMAPVVVAGLAGLVLATVLKFAAVLWGWEMGWRLITVNLGPVSLNIPNYEFFCVGMIVAGFLGLLPTPEWTPQDQQTVAWTTLQMMFVSAGLLLFTVLSWVSVNSG